VWWTLVLYAINELVPLALFLIPVYWTQQTIVEEERRSIRAQSQVQSFQRQQEELLDALLPSAIVEHIRAGDIFSSKRDAAVIFAYFSDFKRLMLDSASPECVVKWLAEVYREVDEVLRRSFGKTIIKVESQHDHMFAGALLI